MKSEQAALEELLKQSARMREEAESLQAIAARIGREMVEHDDAAIAKQTA